MPDNEVTVDIPPEVVLQVQAAAAQPSPTAPAPAPVARSGSSIWNNVDVSNLPSNGMPYPAGCTLEYRVYGFDEMEMINRANLPEHEMIRIYMNGIILKSAEGTDISGKIAEIDANFLIIQRKLRTMGVHNSFDLEPTCPVCERKLSKRFTLRDVVYDELKDKVPALPMVLPLTSGPMKLSLPTITDMLNAAQKSIPPEKERNFFLSCMAINAGDQRPLMYLQEVIGTTKDPDDQYLLNKAYDLSTVRVHDFVIECEGTKEAPHTKTPIHVAPEEVREGLMKPFRESTDTPRREIQFGA